MGRGGEGALSYSITFDNASVVAVDAGRRRTPGWAALLISVATVGVAMFGGGALYRVAPAPTVIGMQGYAAMLADRLIQYGCILGPLAIVAVVMTKVYEGRPDPRPVVADATAAAIGAGAGGGLFLLALAMAWGLGAVIPGAGAGSPSHRLAGVVAGALLILLQVGIEEGFFRGWLQPVLAARWGPWFGLGVTSLLFAVAHSLVARVGVLALVNDTLAGLAFGLLALRTGGLAAPIAAHWGWNWTEQSLVGATPNPGVDPLGALFDLDLRGPGLIAGGADEMNGSICATLALLLLVALAAGLRPRGRA